MFTNDLLASLTTSFVLDGMRLVCFSKNCAILVERDNLLKVEVEGNKATLTPLSLQELVSYLTEVIKISADALFSSEYVEFFDWKGEKILTLCVDRLKELLPFDFHIGGGDIWLDA